jgi:trehalose-6-phosphate synthase
MHAGLIMDLSERRDRHQALLARVRQGTARRFCEIFMAALTRDLAPDRIRPSAP